MRATLLHVDAKVRTVTSSRCRLLSSATWLACENGRKLLYLPPWQLTTISPVLWSESVVRKTARAGAGLCDLTASHRSLAPLLKAHEDLTRSGTIPSDPLGLLQVSEMTKMHEAYRQYWLVDHAHKFAPGSFRLLWTHSAILNCDNSYARHVQEGSDTSRNGWIDACLLALSNVAELSEKNDLEYWCVSAFTHISRFGTMIYAVCHPETLWTARSGADSRRGNVRPCHSAIASSRSGSSSSSTPCVKRELRISISL